MCALVFFFSCIIPFPHSQSTISQLSCFFLLKIHPNKNGLTNKGLYFAGKWERGQKLLRRSVHSATQESVDLCSVLGLSCCNPIVLEMAAVAPGITYHPCNVQYQKGAEALWIASFCLQSMLTVPEHTSQASVTRMGYIFKTEKEYGRWVHGIQLVKWDNVL